MYIHVLIHGMYGIQRRIPFFNMPSHKAEEKVQKAGRTVGEKVGKNINKCCSPLTFPNIKKHGEAACLVK